MTRTVAVIWRKGRPRGSVAIANGALAGLAVAGGRGSVEGEQFAFRGGECRLEIAVAEARVAPGAHPTAVSLRTETNPFTFLLRDVVAEHPIIIPDLGVAVTEADDRRPYAELLRAVRNRKLKTSLQRIAADKEESYPVAAANTRTQRCPTWLGLSRDMRIFEFGYGDVDGWFRIQPRFHGTGVMLPESHDQPVAYYFWLGRGMGCVEQLTRRLEDGTLPILHGEFVDDDIAYRFTVFVSPETSPLTIESLRGTHFLVADGHGLGHMFTPEQQGEYDALLPSEMERPEETVACCRVEAVNTAEVPRYAWLRAPDPRLAYDFNGRTGFGSLESGRVFAVCKLDGAPLPQTEVAVLVQPGAKAVFELLIPHRPIAPDRAERLAGQDFVRRHVFCRLLL
jgi:hypothetical protein